MFLRFMGAGLTHRFLNTSSPCGGILLSILPTRPATPYTPGIPKTALTLGFPLGKK